MFHNVRVRKGTSERILEVPFLFSHLKYCGDPTRQEREFISHHVFLKDRLQSTGIERSLNRRMDPQTILYHI